MARIIREERRQRGVFGWIILLLFWGFNAFMLWWLIAGVSAMRQVDVGPDKYSQAGATIGIGIGIGFIVSIWGFGAVILGLMALLTRGKTIVIERAPAGVMAAAEVDTSLWSKKDRLAYEADRRPRREPAMITPPRAAAFNTEPSRHYRDLAAPVTALLVLAQAGAAALDQRATDAIMVYLEAENGAVDYSRREAGQVLDWIQALPADEESIRAAVRTLPGSIGSVQAFIAAMDTITAPSPTTDRQARWLAALKRQVGVA